MKNIRANGQVLMALLLVTLASLNVSAVTGTGGFTSDPIQITYPTGQDYVNIGQPVKLMAKFRVDTPGTFMLTADMGSDQLCPNAPNCPLSILTGLNVNLNICSKNPSVETNFNSQRFDLGPPGVYEVTFYLVPTTAGTYANQPGHNYVAVMTSKSDPMTCSSQSNSFIYSGIIKVGTGTSTTPTTLSPTTTLPTQMPTQICKSTCTIKGGTTCVDKNTMGQCLDVDGKGCLNVVNVPCNVAGSCMTSSCVSSVTVSTVTTSTLKSAIQQQCESSGGLWSGGTCVFGPVPTPSQDYRLDIVAAVLLAVGAIALILYLISKIRRG